jgi:hypothetical protein
VRKNNTGNGMKSEKADPIIGKNALNRKKRLVTPIPTAIFFDVSCNTAYCGTHG